MNKQLQINGGDSDCASDHEQVEAAAQKLAQQHYRLQPEITEIRTVGNGFVEQTQGAIKLLEINPSIPASGVAMPLGFKAMPASGIPYPSIIISVNPEEFRRIESGEMLLPPGWNIQESKSVPKPVDNGDE